MARGAISYARGIGFDTPWYQNDQCNSLLSRKVEEGRFTYACVYNAD